MSNTGSAVATITSGANTPNPTIVLNSLGTFNIVATVSSSKNKNYNGTILTSLPIKVYPDIPDIEFSPLVASNSPYTYRYEDPYDYIEPAASITNNTGQTLNYSIVTADSTINSLTPSTVATIDPSGCFLTTVSCGATGTSTFRICASADERLDGDFGPNKALSDILTIVKATPTILQYPQITLPTGVTASTLVYGQEYTINPLPITVTGIATQYNYVGYGAQNINADTLSYASWCADVTGSTCHAEYRLRFSNGIVSNLTLTSDSPGGLTNPDLLFALSNVPYDGVTAILQGLNISTGSDNLWYDVDVPEQFITQNQSTVTFSGNTGNFKSTPSLFQTSVSTISSNTDTNPYPTIIYSIIGNIIGTNNRVATITGTTVQIVGIGSFQIAISVSSTTNYNKIPASVSSQIYETIKAVPTIKSFPTIPQTLVYKGTPYVIPSTIITSNTDIPGPSIVTYTSSDTNVATISGNTITVAGVTGIVNGIGTGNYQILVTIHATKNFSEMTYTYPSLTTYYQTIWATPNITFSKKAFVTSSVYGSTYNFVAPNFSNYDPSSQTLTYSIVNSKPVVPSSTSVATLVYKSGVTNPSVVINSVGTFQIQASCLASANLFYSHQTATSDLITISKEIPNIEFNTSHFKSSYTYKPTTPYTFTSSSPIASITPNNGNQILTYSIVATDGVTPSTVATISSIGTGASQIISLTTKSVGSSFKILATAAATSNGDYGQNSVPSETITIISATPTITKFPTLPSKFIYGNQYTIPYTTTPPYTIITTNTDIPGPTITYSSSNTAFATISGSVNYSSISNSAISSITGTTITIVGVGQFQINVTIGATTYYNKATYVYPSPTTYYTSKQATPTITFPSNFGSGWVIGGKHNLTSTVTTNAGPGYPIPNPVIYSIINPSVSNIATINTSGSGSGSGSQIKINDAGTFQIQADLAATPNFTSATSVQSNTITITASNVSILSNNFSNFVYGGGPYTLSVTTNNTDTNPAPTITYQIFPQSGSTGNGTINGNVLTITSAGGAYIYVNISQTQNFYSLNTCIYVNIAQATQTIVLNSGWISSNIYTSTIASSFGCFNFILSNQSNNPSPSYSFTVIQQASINIVNVASDYTITCVSPGTFYLNITAAATTNYSQTTVSTPTMYVSVVPEVIIFNNPETWPPVSGSTEVGMAICITNDSYPNGFNNYSALTITNGGNGATFTFDATTTTPTYGMIIPTYSSIIREYIVCFDPNASTFLAGAMSNTPPSNVAYGGINSIATGISTGQALTFTFSGNTAGQGFPDPLTINWNPGTINIQPGQVYGAFYPYANNITPSQNLPNGNGVTVSTLNSGGITGYYIAPWAGYGCGYEIGTNATTTGIPAQNALGYTPYQQAWGVWPITSYGLQFGSTITFDNVNYCYVGIPQLTNPVTYNA